MINNQDTRPRVVITGMGAITALGSSVEQLWTGLVNGESGIRRITHFDSSELPCQIAGEVPDFNVSDYMERKHARHVSRSSQIALGAAAQAVADAGLEGNISNPERTAVVFGTAMGGLERTGEGIVALRTKGFNRVNPYTIPAGIPNLAAFLIAQEFKCLGPNNTITTACAAGTQSIGEGAEYIRRGVADVVIAGGTEALIQDFSIAGFSSMRALPVNYNDNPGAASRPFDAKREGFLFSEGAGALVLERYEHAQSRGARIYAEVGGHASSADGYHVAALNPTGHGPIRAMRWALQDANIDPGEVDYINAHGTSTPSNDPIETNAIKTVFGEHANKLAVSSSKSMLGHAMGASGAIEAIVCALIINKNTITPTINYEYPDPECDLDYVPNKPRHQKVNVTLSNSFGLGGQNACLVLKNL